MSNKSHGHAINARHTPEYKAWHAMIRRCYDPSTAGWRLYGARDIRVCKLWREYFSVFLRDVGPRPGPGYSLDRIDVNGDYEPSNVRWATAAEQNRNRRSNVIVEYMGRRMCLKDAADLAGMNYRTAWMRLRKGWQVERALTEPLHNDKVPFQFRKEGG